MKFESTLNIKSEVPGFEDVTYTIFKPSMGRRNKLRLALSSVTNKANNMIAEVKLMDADESTDPEAKQLVLMEAGMIVAFEITPVYVRWGLRSIEGMDIDGEPATTESLIESGPEALYNEIALRIKKEAGLSDEEKGESERPSTSGNHVEASITNTSAETAGQ